MSGPYYGNHDRAPEGENLGHNTQYWNDGDGTAHRESYDYDGQGNVSGLRYVQSDRYGSKLVYNYHTEQWEDHSK